MEISERLEKRLRETGNYDRLKSHYDTIVGRGEKNDKRYAQCLIDFLELSLAYEKNHVNHVTLGGLATLAQLYRSDKDAAIEWRGTDDIDILAKLNEIQPTMDELGYQKPQTDSKRRKGAVGVIYNYVKANIPSDNMITVGVRQGIEINEKEITEKIVGDSDIVDFYGVRVKVANVSNLISMKKYACRGGRNKSKDRKDIKDLKGLLRS